MIIKLATTNKKTNSTYIPSSWREVYVHLKEGTNVINPRFILSASKMVTKLDTTKESVEDNACIRDYNYIYVPAFKRYYYITNFTLVSDDVIEISCTVDVLASAKEDIRNANCVYVRTPFRNDNVLEETIPLSKYESVLKNTTALWSDLTSIGIYLDVAGKATASCNPTTSTYFMSIGTLKALMGKVFDPTTYGQGGTAVAMDILSQTICNPSQYIVGCRVGRITTHGSAVTSIKFGWMDVPVEGAYLVQDGNYVYKINRTISFPDYTNDITKNYMLYIPNFGSVKLSSNDAVSPLNIEVAVDMHSGEGHCYVTNARGKLVYRGVGACMVNMPVSGVVANRVDLKEGITASVGNRLIERTQENFNPYSKGVVWDKLSNMLKGNESEATLTPVVDVNEIANRSIERNVFTMGGSGTLAELLSHGYIEAYTLTNSRLTPSNGQGYPNYYYGKITNDGYYKASHVELNSNLYVSERSSIVNFLQSGIYFN